MPQKQLWIRDMSESASISFTSGDSLSRNPTPFRPQRPVILRRAAVLSALGRDLPETLKRLASPEDQPLDLTPEAVRVPDALLAEAEARIAKAASETGFGAFAHPTRSLKIAAAAALPLFDEALAAGFAPADIGFVLGSTTAGTAETVASLKSHRDASIEDKWLSIEIGATASLKTNVCLSGNIY